MQVSATLRKKSHIHHSWIERSQIGGMINGVKFNKRGQVFVAEDLQPDQAERLRHHRLVDIEIMGKQPAAPYVAQDVAPSAPVEPETTEEDDIAALLGEPIAEAPPPVKRPPGRPRKV